MNRLGLVGVLALVLVLGCSRKPPAPAVVKEGDGGKKEKLPPSEVREGDKDREAGRAAKRKAELAKHRDYDRRMAQGRKAMKDRRYAEALGEFAAALKARPGDAAATKAQRKARQVLDQLALTAGRATLYHRALAAGQAAVKRKDYQAAVNAYKEALRLFPGDKPATKARDAAQRFLDREIAARKRQYDLQMDLGRTAVKDKRYADAVKAFVAALKAKPGDAAALKGEREARQALDLTKNPPVDPRKDKKRLARYKQALAAGRAAVKKKDYQGAVNAYKEALRLIPGDETATEARDIAQRFLDREIAAKKGEYDRRMALGRTAVKDKRYADAVKAFGEALKVKPADAAATKERQQAQKALELAKKPPDKPVITRKQREDYKLAMDAGRAAAKKKNYLGAFNAYKEALRIIPGDKTATEARDAAKRLIDKEIAARKAEYERQMAQGRTAAKGKRYADAVKAFAVALKARPGDAAATREQREAQKALDLSKKTPPRPVDKKRLEDFKLAMDAGRAAAKKKNYLGAFNAYKEAVRLIPGDKTAIEARDAARRLLDQENGAKGKAAYDRQMALGRTAMTGKRYADAVKAFGEARKLKPGDATATRELFGAHLGAGKAAHAARRYPEAVKSYQEALKLQPSNAAVKAALARAKAKKP
jgi:tetratricopeptide (TPR) repeat protein